jgi:protein-tyrosine phosphatase
VRNSRKASPVKAFFVSKRLAFGSAIKTKTHVKKLRALGITHVINLRRSNNKNIQRFCYLWLPFPDDLKPRPRWFYKRTLKFFRKAMRHRGAKLLVMCHHGICRSASLTSFLLRSAGKGQNKAERRIKMARPTARIVPAYRESSEKYLKRIGL